MQSNGFLTFFGLRENPFSVNLDPRFLFVTPHLEKIFSELMVGIHSGNSFAVITGEVGSGKTTLMHRLRRRLRQQGTPTAFIFYTHLDRARLLDFILADFGIPCNPGETIDAWKRLENWLVERHGNGQTPVLLVDEAQGLPSSAFEEIRMLLNLETPREKLLQIVLAGESELEDKFKRPQMRELQQRITAHCQTPTLNRDETFGYVLNRLQVGGVKEKTIFQYDAMEALYLHSHGIPRVINILCEQALIDAYARRLHTVIPQLIQEVARDFQWGNGGSLPAKESSHNITTASNLLVPPNATPTLPIVTETVLEEQPDASTALASIVIVEPAPETLLNKPNPSPISDSFVIPLRQNLQSAAQRTAGQRLIVFSDRGKEKTQLTEITDSATRQLLAEFVRDLQNQKRFSRSPARANIRHNEQHSSPQRPAAAAFWMSLLRDGKIVWRKMIGATMNLPDWQRRVALLQRWLMEPMPPIRWRGRTRTRTTTPHRKIPRPAPQH
jgi:general secretion pathway protein A